VSVDTLIPFEVCIKNNSSINTIYSVNIDALVYAVMYDNSPEDVRDEIMRNVFAEMTRQGFTGSIDNVDFASPLLPTHIGMSDFELYYVIDGLEYMCPPDKYTALVYGLGVQHDDLINNLLRPVFGTDDMNMLLPRMNTCAVHPGSTQLAMYFTWDYGLMSEWERLVSATGNTPHIQTELLRYLYPSDTIHTIITSKSLGFGLTYADAEVSHLKYYLLYNQMDSSVHDRLASLTGYTIEEAAAQHSITHDPYLIGLNIVDDSIAASKIYFRHTGV
jgi:hypothetical protein